MSSDDAEKFSPTDANFRIFEDPVLDEEFFILDEGESLADKRRRMTLHIPVVEERPEYVPQAEDLHDLLSEYPKWLQTVAHQGKIPPEKWKISGREVGDDRVDISNSAEQSALLLTVQESIVGMRTSLEDTGITKDLWNFCEVSTGLPCTKETMFTHARKNDNFKNLDFVDSPPLRTVIDTTKVERIHSTSYIGKSRILGAKRRSSNAVCSAYLSVANTFQDACLATWKGPEPKYLPSTLGGCHCPDSYNDPVNTYLYMKSFRGGGYDRLYGTAVEEAKEALRLTEDGQPTPCVVAEVLRDDDTYCFATFANLVAVPDVDKFLTGDETLPDPLYERAGVRNEVTATESRLVQAKRLIPKTQARVEWEKSRRLRDYIFGHVDIVEDQRSLREASLRRRAQISGALRGNTAFMSLVNRTGHREDITRLFQQGWKPCVLGQREFSLDHAYWLSKGGKGEYLSLFDIPSTQDMYVRSEVSAEESLKVGGITLEVQGSSSFMVQNTVTKVGLYEITSTMEEWCDDKMSRLISARDEVARPLRREELLPIFTENREWINDDSNLIEKCIVDTSHLGRETQVALVSSDRRQANQMARQANVKVVLVEPRSLCTAFPHKTWTSTTELTCSEVFEAYPSKFLDSKFLQMPSFVYLDTGSILSALSSMTKEDSSDGVTRYYVKKLISTERLSDGRRSEKYKKEQFFGTSRLQVKVFDPRKKDPYQRSRREHARDAASFHSESWNRGPRPHFSQRSVRRAVSGVASTHSAPT